MAGVTGDVSISPCVSSYFKLIYYALSRQFMLVLINQVVHGGILGCQELITCLKTSVATVTLKKYCSLLHVTPNEHPVVETPPAQRNKNPPYC